LDLNKIANDPLSLRYCRSVQNTGWHITAFLHKKLHCSSKAARWIHRFIYVPDCSVSGVSPHLYTSEGAVFIIDITVEDGMF